MATGKLTGRAALITGAGAGIGRASALALAAEGAAVLCADLDANSASAVAADIEAAGGRAAGTGCDVTDGGQVRAAVAHAVEAFGGLQVVMANAATYTEPTPIAELSEEDWRRTIEVNLTGVFLTCKYAIPELRRGGGGSVILTASQMARVVAPGGAAYSTTKGALLQLAKGIAVDYAGDGVRANTLSPGGIATGRLARRFGDLETAERDWGPRHPLGRLGRPEEMARGAVFLASDESSFMTGADLLMDGGYVAV